MNKTIRTYRIREYNSENIEDFHITFFSSEFSGASINLDHKGHSTKLTKRNNQDFLIDSTDYKNQDLKIFAGEHLIKKNTPIKVDEVDDTGKKVFDHYFIPNVIEFLNFPKKKLLITKANKIVFNHAIKGIEKKYDYEIPSISIDLRKLAKNEENIMGLNIKPNTANCDTILAYGTDVDNDSKIKEVLDNPNSHLSTLMIKISLNSQDIVISVTADCGIVIYKWNENLKDDLDIIFYVYDTIIKNYLK